MEPYIPLSRIPGSIIVASLSGKPLAPVRYLDPEAEVVSPVPPGEVTTLRAMVGATKTPTIREVFMAA